ncbi:MAG TPA: LysM peptidoglycan-binding domain-containing protein [Deltaproteobacteria bacterium]|nr:LysM peptidoglycan-binding domain-containing protein [Deltaproteobacteria bacterium]
MIRTFFLSVCLFCVAAACEAAGSAPVAAAGDAVGAYPVSEAHVDIPSLDEAAVSVSDAAWAFPAPGWSYGAASHGESAAAQEAVSVARPLAVAAGSAVSGGGEGKWAFPVLAAPPRLPPLSEALSAEAGAGAPDASPVPAAGLLCSERNHGDGVYFDGERGRTVMTAAEEELASDDIFGGPFADNDHLAFFDDPFDEFFFHYGGACGDDASSLVVTYDVPVVMNKRVERFIEYFQTRGRRVFVRWLERGARYMPMIRRLIRESGLPEDLSYLAMIESGFNPRARSRAGAVGMWQFMKYTARKYGLRVDWWIDERRDPEKATKAAIKYLSDLYGMFGSWHLAAASYNAGEGRVMRAVRRYKSNDFWELAKYRRALKRETRNYIPKFMAAMIIAKDPAAYGFDDPSRGEPLRYEKAPVPYATDLRVIARAAGTTVDEIRRLNPELLRWFTPPDYPGYEIKLPAGTAETFSRNMKKIAPPQRLRFHRHRIRPGETLSTIARRYRTGVRPIMYLNNIKNPRRIRAGRTLVVPVRARPAAPAQKTVRSAGRGGSGHGGVASDGTYTVRRGDTLWDIALRFGVPLKRVMRLNGLSADDLIRPGQKLVISETMIADEKDDTKLR